MGGWGGMCSDMHCLQVSGYWIRCGECTAEEDAMDCVSF